MIAHTDVMTPVWTVTVTDLESEPKAGANTTRKTRTPNDPIDSVICRRKCALVLPLGGTASVSSMDSQEESYQMKN